MSHRFGPRARAQRVISAMVSQWMRPSPIRLIQRGSITIAGGAATNTATITAVVVANTRLRWLGNSSTVLDQADNGYARIALTNATTITATRGDTPAGTCVVSYEAIEYWPGVIRSVQRDTITVSADPTDDTITSVTMGKSEVDYLGFSLTSTAASIACQPRVALLNATTVRANESTLGGIVGYQVIEWW